jgi:hypothetical protein
VSCVVSITAAVDSFFLRESLFFGSGLLVIFSGVGVIVCAEEEDEGFWRVDLEVAEAVETDATEDFEPGDKSTIPPGTEVEVIPICSKCLDTLRPSMGGDSSDLSILISLVVGFSGLTTLATRAW